VITDDDVRTMLRQRAAEAHVSDDAWERIADRLEQRPPRHVGRSVAAVAAAAAALVAGLLAWPNPGGQVVLPPATPTTLPVALPPHVWAAPEGETLAEAATSYVMLRAGLADGRQEPVMADESHGSVRFTGDGVETEVLLERAGERWLVVAAASDLVPIFDPAYDGSTFAATVVAEAAGQLTASVRAKDEDGAEEGFAGAFADVVRAREEVSIRHERTGEPGLGLLVRLMTDDGTLALGEVWAEVRDDPATSDGGLVAVWPATDAEGVRSLQAQADSGERPDLLDPRAVAASFLTEVLDGSADFGVEPFQQGDATSGEVPYSLADGADGTVLVRRSGGEGSVWYVVGATSSSLEIAEVRREETHLVADVRSSMDGTLQWTGATPVGVRGGEIVSIGRPDTPLGAYPVVVRLVDDGATRAVAAELSRT